MKTTHGNEPAVAGDASDEMELLSFRVADEEFSVAITSVREIRGWTRTTSLPRSPDYVRGVINLRGTVLPVLDLGMRLGLDTTEPTDRSVIIVVDLGARTAGLRVDAVSDILSVPASSLQPPPGREDDSAGGFLAGLSMLDGKMIRVISLDALLPRAELAS